jgi:dTMP kinase
VICDRFADSTYAYQGAGRGMARETIRRIDSVVLDDFHPDLTLMLDLDVATGLRRAATRTGDETRFERFDVSFHEQLRQAFIDVARRAPGRCRLIDASGSEDAVAEAILREVRAHFGL